ncbi:molybdopterin dinucleotide binding domain-containing protein [Streptomyces sp. NBC_00259]|uniref:molybdopterin dinucleotide binding domain-containing protein n=1 Tax=Streptomyces sp. NBC_00259 TaxID=2903643 RepID=UPI002E2913D7|nr:molybdopterin dinucleotide binding domain-containing protein [Streptomyces sp. NBC_00259]
MVSVGPADRFDAFRALADRRRRPGDRLIESLAEAGAGTTDRPETLARIREAVGRAYANGHLGASVHGTDTTLNVQVVEGAGSSSRGHAQPWSPSRLAIRAVSSPATYAVRYDVLDSALVAVEIRHGRARLIARISEQTAPGQVFSSFHFPASGVNRLTSDRVDTVTSCPEYKVTAVRVVVP